MGITFKPDVDDIRESPALYIFNCLKKSKKQILVHDPNINSLII